MKFKFVSIVALLVSALFVVSCANTVRGVSRDMKQTGQAVEEGVE